jgi:hypothetical protein
VLSTIAAMVTAGHSERNGGVFFLHPVPRDGPPCSRRIPPCLVSIRQAK